MSSTQPDLLAVVERSPAAVGAHDRATWVGLFTPDGQVEDPVGSRPHTGTEAINRFYDTFIAPRDITFHRDLDIVRGSTVVRDLRLEVAMGPAVTMHIPAFLRYDLRADGDDWRLARMRAYWELPAMMRQFLGNGAAALPAALQLSKSLLGDQGWGGTAGFAAGFRNPGARGKTRVGALLAALARRDVSAAMHMLAPDATLSYGDDTVTDAAGLGEDLAGARGTKLIGAGRTVAAAIESDRGRGVLFADLNRWGTVIDRIRYFPQNP